MVWPNIAALADTLKSGERSIVELTQHCLDRIEATNDYHAILEVNLQAVARAKELQELQKRGQAKGRLFGVPYIAKDNLLTTTTHTTAASNILKNFEAPYQATAIERVEAEGAIMLGKANLDAFAHGSSTENSDFGPTKNPADSFRVPGGSSGGSAAAVALKLVPFALGTDTGGSIRLPASFCGTVGLKPTYGLVSRYGVIAMASSFDVVGPLTRTVEDAAYILEILAGKDPKDATTIERSHHAYGSSGGPSNTLKFGIIKEHLEGAEPEVKTLIDQQIEVLIKAGNSVTEVSIPSNDLALATYYVLVPAEISSNLARYDGIKYGLSAAKAQELAEVYDLSRSQGFNVENKRRIMIGTYVLSSGYYDAYYKRAQKVRTLLRQEYARAFEGVDVLLGPTAPAPAFRLGERHDPLSMYLTDIMTVSANLVGIPAISIPAGLINGLPVGLQLMAPQQREQELFSAARLLEVQIGGLDG